MDGITITTEHILCLLVYLLKDEAFGLKCLQKYDSELLFENNEHPLRIIWQTLSEYVKEESVIPSEQVLLANAIGRIRQFDSEDQELESEVRKYIKLIYEAKNLDDKSLTKQFAINVLNLLVDRFVKRNLEEGLQHINGDLTAFRELINKISEEYENSIAVDVSISTLSTIPSNFLSESNQVELIPTGVPFIDKMMSGGSKPGEVYVLLGSTGSGKSLLSEQICVEGARQAENSPRSRGLNVFFSYELKKEDLFYRALCQGANIPAKRLNEVMKCGPSKVFGEMDYEANMFIGNCGLGFSEENRLERARKFLNSYARFVDMSGNPELGITLGSGGVSELVAIVNELQQQSQLPIRNVVIDWAELCIRRYADAKGLDHSRVLITELGNFVRAVHTNIALKFNCSAYIVHQLSGDIVDKASKHHIYHNHAAWCKSFGNSAWYVFVLHNQDRGSRVSLLSCTKSRRSELPDDVLIQLRDDLRFVDVSGEYEFKANVGVIPKRVIGDLL